MFVSIGLLSCDSPSICFPVLFPWTRLTTESQPPVFIPTRLVTPHSTWPIIQSVPLDSSPSLIMCSSFQSYTFITVQPQIHDTQTVNSRHRTGRLSGYNLKDLGPHEAVWKGHRENKITMVIVMSSWCNQGYLTWREGGPWSWEKKVGPSDVGSVTSFRGLF